MSVIPCVLELRQGYSKRMCQPLLNFLLELLERAYKESVNTEDTGVRVRNVPGGNHQEGIRVSFIRPLIVQDDFRQDEAILSVEAL